MTALNAIVELVKADGRSEDLNFLLDIIENDPEPRVRHQLLLMLAQHPPFERGRGHPLDTTSVMERLWKLMKYAIIVIYCEFQMMTFFLFFLLLQCRPVSRLETSQRYRRLVPLPLWTTQTALPFRSHLPKSGSSSTNSSRIS